MKKLNKLLRQPQQSYSRPLVFHCHRAPCVVTLLRRWAAQRKGESQAGYLTCLADAEYSKGQEGPLSLVSWHSGRCRRIARSSLSADVQAAREAQEEGEDVSLVIANMWNASDQGALLPRALVLDGKALFDGVSPSESSALGLSDKRSGLEAMALPFLNKNTSALGSQRSSVGRCYDAELTTRSATSLRNS